MSAALTGIPRGKMTRPRSHEQHYEGPAYEVRLHVPDPRVWRLELWQMPAPSTPRINRPVLIATLKGRPLTIVENRILKKMKSARIELGILNAGDKRAWPVTEDFALHLGLIFRAIAPMRNIDRIRTVTDCIEQMNQEEASYWLGMAMHRKNPRKVLAALRMLCEAN